MEIVFCFFDCIRFIFFKNLIARFVLDWCNNIKVKEKIHASTFYDDLWPETRKMRC